MFTILTIKKKNDEALRAYCDHHGATKHRPCCSVFPTLISLSSSPAITEYALKLSDNVTCHPVFHLYLKLYSSGIEFIYCFIVKLLLLC